MDDNEEERYADLDDGFGMEDKFGRNVNDVFKSWEKCSENGNRGKQARTEDICPACFETNKASDQHKIDPV